MRIELNSAEIKAFLHSAPVGSLVETEAKKIAGRAGKDYATDIYHASGRVIASVYTATPAGIRDNSRNQTLLKALHGK